MHSGDHRQAHPDFVHKGYVLLGWRKLRDLRLLANDRKAFRTEFRKHYREPPPAVGIKAGELYRFVHEVKPGHFMIYPSGKDGLVRIGRVERDYEHRPRLKADFPHVHKVKWLKELRRNTLSPEAKRALSGRLSLYTPRKYADELRATVLPRNIS